MGIASYKQTALEMYRQAFTVPAVSGNYAPEVITFGPTPSGTNVSFFREITAIVEGANLSGATVELWLAQIPDSSTGADGRTPGNYWNATSTAFPSMTTTGVAQRWQLSAWPGAQIRVKSGGTPATITIDASGY